jgi:hypothetical protein
VILPYGELPDEAGGWPRPLVDVAVGGVEDVAGIDLDQAEGRGLAVGGITTRAAFAITSMAAADHTGEAEVGFCDPWPFGWGLLGQASFFRFFTVIFNTADFELELLPNDR